VLVLRFPLSPRFVVTQEIAKARAAAWVAPFAVATIRRLPSGIMTQEVDQLLLPVSIRCPVPRRLRALPAVSWAMDRTLS